MTRPNVNVTVGGPKKPADNTYKTIILKNNIGFKEQVEGGDPNCKYIIKWDYDLEGESVLIPENCVLEFDGGSISNGALVGQDTLVVNDYGRENIFNDVARSGSWKYKTNTIEELSLNTLVAGGTLNIEGTTVPATEPTNISSAKLYSLDGIDEFTIDFDSPLTSIKWNWYNSDGLYLGCDYYTSRKTIQVPLAAKNGYVGFCTGGTLTRQQVLDSIKGGSLFDCKTIDKAVHDENDKAAYNKTFVRHSVNDFDVANVYPSGDTWKNKENAGRFVFLKDYNASKIVIENCQKAGSGGEGWPEGWPVSYVFTNTKALGGSSVAYVKYDVPTTLRNNPHIVTDGKPYSVTETVPSTATILWIGNAAWGISGDVYISFYTNDALSTLSDKVDGMRKEDNYFRHVSDTECYCAQWNIGHFSPTGGFASDMDTKQKYDTKIAILNNMLNTYTQNYSKGIFGFNEFSDIAARYYYNGSYVTKTAESIIGNYDNWFKGPNNRFTYSAFCVKHAYVNDVGYYKFPASIVNHDQRSIGTVYNDDAYFITMSLYLSGQYVRYVILHIPVVGADNTKECLRYILRNFTSDFSVITGDFNMEIAAVESVLAESEFSSFSRYQNSDFTYCNYDVDPQTQTGSRVTKVLDHIITKNVLVSEFRIGTPPVAPPPYYEDPETQDYLNSTISDHYPIFFKIELANKYRPDTVVRGKDLAKLVRSSGATEDRPTDVPQGFCYLDTDLGKPIWKNGSTWIDATGTEV